MSLSYIAEASAGQPALLEALTSGGLVGQALQLVSEGWCEGQMHVWMQ